MLIRHTEIWHLFGIPIACPKIIHACKKKRKLSSKNSTKPESSFASTSRVVLQLRINLRINRIIRGAPILRRLPVLRRLPLLLHLLPHPLVLEPLETVRVLDIALLGMVLLGMVLLDIATLADLLEIVLQEAVILEMALGVVLGVVPGVVGAVLLETATLHPTLALKLLDMVRLGIPFRLAITITNRPLVLIPPIRLLEPHLQTLHPNPLLRHLQNKHLMNQPTAAPGIILKI
jgi:hypothetical protein